ncbi:helix-turn-helix transcriptional regulator [Pseudomonas pseudonitroreducens]|uniref:helix-turn-helix transcriptional regulator n=1 Tax=Pseudomonas pseudonitroreducens TaxID=2892326 RepID=UPI001F3C7BC1|nr:hypothetical protein [Pseudomonas pseudonitroreducens]
MSALLAPTEPRRRQPPFVPRFIRAKDAPAYLGMCRDEFNRTVRPHVHEFPIGSRGVGFDREELDAWADAYIEQQAIAKAANSAKNQGAASAKESTQWREKESRASRRGTGSGISTRKSTENDFTRALELVTGPKRKGT